MHSPQISLGEWEARPLTGGHAPWSPLKPPLAIRRLEIVSEVGFFSIWITGSPADMSTFSICLQLCDNLQPLNTSQRGFVGVDPVKTGISRFLFAAPA